MELRKMTTVDIAGRKGSKNKITALAVYDYPFARIADKTGVDILLVGDSLGTVVLGYENTLAVTMDDMVSHAASVKRGVENALLVVDMPFMSYQVSIESAIENAGRLLKEGGAEAVKLEGGEEMMETVGALVEVGIPVMGHVGLTPQSIHKIGGYRVQGKKSFEAKQIVEDAMAIVEAGAFAIVLEGIPLEVAKEITNRVGVPTIGIGAGVHCDGQIMVLHDLLGLSGSFKPKFVKRYGDLGGMATDHIGAFLKEVQDGEYPDEKTSYTMDKGHLRAVTKKGSDEDS